MTQTAQPRYTDAQIEKRNQVLDALSSLKAFIEATVKAGPDEVDRVIKKLDKSDKHHDDAIDDRVEICDEITSRFGFTESQDGLRGLMNFTLNALVAIRDETGEEK